MKGTSICAILTLLFAFNLSARQKGSDHEYQVTFEKLLDEMISAEQQARMPEPAYRSGQVSSYDRRSVSPDKPGWFANNDGFGIERTDTIDGRI